jgi:hypothetical protein
MQYLFSAQIQIFDCFADAYHKPNILDFTSHQPALILFLFMDGLAVHTIQQGVGQFFTVFLTL